MRFPSAPSLQFLLCVRHLASTWLGNLSPSQTLRPPLRVVARARPYRAAFPCGPLSPAQHGSGCRGRCPLGDLRPSRTFPLHDFLRTCCYHGARRRGRNPIICNLMTSQVNFPSGQLR
ncbi:hypothetical protein NDU88_002877 [Pleurodeles waltl]|uniref:Secreted protein n=1 Tax=Pleurodeles waltl TaxID=8319 RepID=A0AAV7MNX7_PLEWA|nr:hypothetical protein NDU88_002877 [Pleurodeles waltl]